jgi:glyoxylase-like metal-dependent hydrolase (beta-lactamase superfamily II)
MSEDVIPVLMRGVNCYLVRAEGGFALVDTGFAFGWGTLKRALDEAGCRRGDIRLVVITHADFDHTGNCRALRRDYGAKIAMHADEFRSAEGADMLANRSSMNAFFPRAVMGLFRLLGRASRFRPDMAIEDGEDLSAYGFAARAFHLPGHSKGSLGILTDSGDFFCGDLLTTSEGVPMKNRLIDNADEMDESIRRVLDMPVARIYPGHGRPFTKEQLREALA